jgi:2-hydroxychromene-2-carboxylate isomerase
MPVCTQDENLLSPNPLWISVRFHLPMKSKAVRFYFDPISPYSWLAWRPLIGLCAETKATLTPTPILFAGLLNKWGQLGPAEIPPKRMHIMKDVYRRAHLMGLSLSPPPTHPFNPLLALRTLTALGEDASITDDTKFKFITNLLDACWTQGKDLSDKSTIIQVASSCGVSGEGLIHNAQTNQAIKDKLKANTDHAIETGVFGVPTVVIDGEIFWGSEKDTMDHVHRAILGSPVKIPQDLLNRWAATKPSASRK